MYHQVGAEPERCYPLHSVLPETFGVQMKILSRLGFSTIDLDEFYNYRNGLTKLPAKPIIITFDDGLQNAIDNSVPVLNSYGFKAVYYIPTNCIGGRSYWLKPELGFDLPVINWDKIKWLDSNGFQIGCHSMSHPHLDQTSAEECREELEVSKKVLEDNLGHEVNHLAYPYGTYSDLVMDLAARAGFITACTTDAGLCKTKYDSLALPRINISYKDSIIDFITKIHTGFTPYNGTRHLSRKILKKIGIG
jgi:peptidoglycan/xylan/chitin deacetylase (PgdA/CDA1 family)